MGVVYRVRDQRGARRDRRPEAPAPRLVGSAEMLARFRTEVKLARRVTHRNVARTFDIGEHDGERFLTMELIDGASLADVLEKERPLEISRALDITKQMAKGMAAAHDAGVIHRDLKPENVSLERREPRRPDGFRYRSDERRRDPIADRGGDDRHADLHGARAGRGQPRRGRAGRPLRRRGRALRDAHRARAVERPGTHRPMWWRRLASRHLRPTRGTIDRSCRRRSPRW